MMLHKSTKVPIYLLFFITSSPLSAFELNNATTLLYGYDDNINEKPDCEKISTRFFSISPEFSLSAPMKDDITTSGGYRFSYTHYLDDELEGQTHHLGWSKVAAGLKPGLFTSLIAQIEALENSQDSKDDGMSYSLSSDLSYHASELLTTRISGVYQYWRYDNLDFDTGRTTIRLENQQRDDHYEAELSFVSMLSLSTNLTFSYRAIDNESTNSIAEYSGNTLTARIHSAVTSKSVVVIEYTKESRDYDNWRAGKRLKGKLREDHQTSFNFGLEYAYSDSLALFLGYDTTNNDSNLKYQSHKRRQVYGGVRSNW
jgi:hypothetical protein